MIPADILSASNVTRLAAIDVLIATAIQVQGCPRCNAALHASHFQRKPRGVQCDTSEVTIRLSFCCNRDGCRHRVTPPSVRFWGRLVFLGSVVMAALSTDRRSREEEQLRTRIDCSRRSIARWRDRFVAVWMTATGRTAAGAIALDEQQRQQPRHVLSRWGDRWPFVAVMWQLLIHPLTGGTGWETDGQRTWPLDPQNMHFDQELRALQDLPAAL
jgi:hypothetical protein